MKLKINKNINRLIVLISIALIATLALMYLPMKEHLKEWYYNELSKDETQHLKNLNIVIDNYNELYALDAELFDKCSEVLSLPLTQDVIHYGTATGYSLNDPAQGTDSVNAIGWNLQDSNYMNIPQIAADLVLPLGTICRLYVQFEDGFNGYFYHDIGTYVVTDRGYDIRNFIDENGEEVWRVDILFSTKEAALRWGEKNIAIVVLSPGVCLSSAQDYINFEFIEQFE